MAIRENGLQVSIVFHLAGTDGALLKTMARRIYLFIVTLFTLLVALAALLMFVTMEEARADELNGDSVVDSLRSHNHYGRGVIRIAGGDSLTFVTYQKTREIPIAPDSEVGVNFDTSLFPVDKYIELEVPGAYKILLYVNKFFVRKKSGAEATYVIRGQNVNPPQNYDLEIEVKSDPISSSRILQRRRCGDGRYYDLVAERQVRIQNVSLRLLDSRDSSKTLGTLSTRPTRVSKDVRKLSTACSELPAPPAPELILTGSSAPVPAIR